MKRSEKEEISYEEPEVGDPIKVVIGLGSNFGDRRAAVEQAMKWLSEKLIDMRSSKIYETPAFGDSGAPYMNAVVTGYYRNLCSLETLEKACKRYEIDHGRDDYARSNKFVPIDIDIVMAGHQILRPADFSRSFFRIGYYELEPKD